jgi:hypothetical protein
MGAALKEPILEPEDATQPSLPVESYKDAAPLLRRPFTAAAVKFKVQATWGPKDQPANAALIVAYIDARLAIERLNLVCPHLWEDDYKAIGDGLMWCYLTVDGITRKDVGEGKGKGLVSDALKRAAVHFGVGVSLYAIPKIVLKSADKHVVLKQNKLALTPAGEERCRTIYEMWLDTRGKQAFGEPLDHGDVDDAAGDGDLAEAPAESAEAERARAKQDADTGRPDLQTPPIESDLPAPDMEGLPDGSR